VLKRASLIDAARKRDWSRLSEMLDYVSSKDRDEIFVTSLIRMIPASEDPGSFLCSTRPSRTPRRLFALQRPMPFNTSKPEKLFKPHAGDRG